MFHQTHVEILPSQVSVTIRGQDGEVVPLDGHDRHVEGAPTKVEDEDGPVLGGLLVQAVRNGSRGRFVYDGQHVKASNFP